MKVPIGADVHSGAAHGVAVTAANGADIGQLPNLLRADDAAVFGDAGYASDSYKRGARALGICLPAAGRRKPGRGNLSASQKQRNRRHSRVRARVAHVFRIIKCQSSASSAVRLSSPKTEPFGYRKVRYKELAKNRVQVMSMVALANLPACLLRQAAGRYISVTPVFDGLLTGEVRPKGAKGVKKQQKTRCSVPTRD